MFRLIKTTKTFNYQGFSLSELPFILNEDGKPLDVINDYIFDLAFRKERNIASTVWRGARNIVCILNALCELKVEWGSVKESHLLLIRNNFTQKVNGGRIIAEGTINSYFRSFCAYLWWAESKGYCHGVIGINDAGKSELKYRVPLDPPKSKDALYNIPWLLKETTRRIRPKGSVSDWDSALEQTINYESKPDNLRGDAKRHRDEMILRLIREAKLRRVEVTHLTIDQFAGDSGVDGDNVWITLKKTKTHKTREVRINIELYYDVRDFVEMSRSEIVHGKPKSNILFPSLKTGQKLKEGSINKLLAEYGVKPHDGRSLGLTERFIDLIEKGLGEKEATLIVSQEAGHSMKTGGDTFHQHYLQAKQVIGQTSVKPRGALIAENLRLKKALAKLEE